jgi:nucleoside transporter
MSTAQAQTAPAAIHARGGDPTVLIRLSIMMFLQYAIWGAWAPALASYLANTLNFSGQQVGGIYGCLWLACMIGPFVGGQIVDRYMPTQVFLGIAHLLGAFLAYMTAIQTEFTSMWFWMLLYSLLYAPTLALTNSICFHNLSDAERQFGRIRMWGTAGWIVVGLAVWPIRSLFGTENWAGRSDLLIITAVLSAVMGAFCFMLPHTPPRGESRNPFAFFEALSLLKDRNFLVFMLISFVVTTELQFYYIPTAPFLEDRGVSKQSVTAVMTVAQVAEILVLLLLLHVSLKHLGVRKTMIIGILAWPLRYLLFTVPSLPVIIGSLPLHGFGYAFFFVASQIYVNIKAKDDMRASAQALLTFFTLGLGNFLGTFFTGWCWDYFKDETTGQTQWSGFFMVPTGICVACAIAFLLLFRDQVREPDKNAIA